MLEEPPVKVKDHPREQGPRESFTRKRVRREDSSKTLALPVGNLHLEECKQGDVEMGGDGGDKSIIESYLLIPSYAHIPLVLD